MIVLAFDLRLSSWMTQTAAPEIGRETIALFRSHKLKLLSRKEIKSYDYE